MIIDKRNEFASATALNTGAAGTYNVGDVIDLSEINAIDGMAQDQAFTFIGTAPFTAAGQLRYQQEGGVTSARVSLPSDPKPRRLDGSDDAEGQAAETSGEPGQTGSADAGGLLIGNFFSAARGCSSASHIPVETAQ